jgi:hypothetical protein
VEGAQRREVCLAVQRRKQRWLSRLVKMSRESRSGYRCQNGGVELMVVTKMLV